MRKRDCYLCGRTARWYGAKAYARHKCPHGKWCPAGRPGGGQGINTPAHCPPCMEAQRERETADRERKECAIRRAVGKHTFGCAWCARPEVEAAGGAMRLEPAARRVAPGTCPAAVGDGRGCGEPRDKLVFCKRHRAFVLREKSIRLAWKDPPAPVTVTACRMPAADPNDPLHDDPHAAFLLSELEAEHARRAKEKPDA